MNARLRVTMRVGDRMQTDERLEPDSWETTAEEFIAENDFAPSEAAEVRALTPGTLLEYGGGAAPHFTVEAVSE